MCPHLTCIPICPGALHFFIQIFQLVASQTASIFNFQSSKPFRYNQEHVICSTEDMKLTSFSSQLAETIFPLSTTYNFNNFWSVLKVKLGSEGCALKYVNFSVL